MIRKRISKAMLNDEIEIVVVDLDVPDSEKAEAKMLLSEEERRRADQFIFERDRNRYTVARAWLRKLLGERLETNPESVEFCYGDYGKPALANQTTSEPLHFNVSHSDDVAVYAFSHGHKIGVDVEAVTEMSDRDEVAANSFSNYEIETFQKLDDSDKSLGFFNCWTRKEAFVKALGDGLRFPLNSFDVTLSPDEPAEILRIGEQSGRDCGWELFSFAPLPGFVGAVAVQSQT